MCGIAGVLGGDWSQKQEVEATLMRMIQRIHHRGPDHQDIWTDSDAQVGLAHCRLAVVDLSPAGNQPMHSDSGRYVIIYNGEIYNHRHLRAQLCEAGYARNWRGHSDTETLLAAIEMWGIRDTLQRSTGMFAFALWDRSARTVTLARDRLGEKPLYYGRQSEGGPLLFGSQLDAIAQHPAFSAEIDRQALTLFLRYNYVPAPFSIFRGIAKLRPGTFVTLNQVGSDANEQSYWSAAEVATRGAADPLELGEDEAVEELERLLERAIGEQMIADVPLGAFLSGGIDSSVVVAIMQKLARLPVKTFTIGFGEKSYNEAEHARAVAAHLGTDHTDLYVTPEQAREVIPRLPQIYDEPFADSSQIPTHLVSALARKHVTVALSGDGGDEVFGGYNRYLYTAELWDKISKLPKPVRGTAARVLTAVSPTAWTRLGSATRMILPRLAKVDRLGDKVHKGASLLTSDSFDDLYSRMISHWRDPSSAVVDGAEPAPEQNLAATNLFIQLAPVERMMARDLVGYLPDDILVKVDRAAMAVSLETRVPFLDEEVIEFAWRLPFDFRLRRGRTKWILRKLLHRHVPEALVDRPKMGFGVPLGAWLRGPLRDWAEELLDDRRLRHEGFFCPGPVQRMWHAHLGGAVDHEHHLWSVLMFQQWIAGSAARAS